MTVRDNKVVSFNYTLTDQDGQELDTTRDKEPLSYLHGAGNIIPGLESALAGKAAGDAVNVRVAPEEGYGARDEDRDG